MQDRPDVPKNIPRFDDIIAEHQKDRYDYSLRAHIITLVVVGGIGFFVLGFVALFGYYLIPTSGAKMESVRIGADSGAPWNTTLMWKDTGKTAAMRFMIGGCIGAVISLWYLRRMQVAANESKEELLRRHNRYGNRYSKN